MVRYFAPDGKELIARRQGVWGAAETAERMIAALRAAGREVPAYLALARDEFSERLGERAVFGMHCFWQGQAALGRLDGVLEARPGWLDGGEVVEVRYDPRRLDFAALVEAARAAGCAGRVYTEDRARQATARALVGDAARLSDATPRDAKDSDDLYHLERSELRFLPLTPLQALRVNGLLADREDPAGPLSPSQLALLPRVRAALARDRRALDGLRRPERLEELGSYARALEARLAAGG